MEITIQWSVLTVLIAGTFTLAVYLVKYIREKDRDKQAFELAIKDKDLEIAKVRSEMEAYRNEANLSYLKLETEVDKGNLRMASIEKLFTLVQDTFTTEQTRLAKSIDCLVTTLSELKMDMVSHRSFHKGLEESQK